MGRSSDWARGAFITVLALLPAAHLACGRTEIWDGETVTAHAIDAGLRHDSGADSSISDAQSDAIADDGSTLDGGDDSDAGPPGPPPPRPTSPLSTATVTSQTPLLRWVLASGADGAEVDICLDRACTSRVSTFKATGSSATPPMPLTQGVYFWRIRGTLGSVVGRIASPVWEFFVGVRSATKNSSWGSTLDVNGDGFADVMIGAPNLMGTTETAHLFFGGMNGLPSTPSASFTYPEHPNGYYRDPIANAGDFDGDGFGDVLIGAPNPSFGGVGSVLVFKGGPSGLSAMPSLPAPTGIGGSFGWLVSSAGDVNGDGYADVIIGANMGQGGAFIYHGSPSGLSPVPSTSIISTTDPSGNKAYLAVAAASAGDIDGDGFGDIVLGSNMGQYAYVYRGSAAGLSATPTYLGAPHHPDTGSSPGFGSSVACAGDVNADGFADVIIGAHADGNGYDATGSVYLYFGGASGISTTAIVIPNPTATSGAAWGAFVGGAGDVDADGYADMLAATNNNSYVILGGPAGPRTLATLLNVPGGGQNFDFGQGALGAGGDVDGDGFADLLAGAPDSNGYAGGAYLYFGSMSGPGAPITIANPGGGAANFFGASVARLITLRPRRAKPG